MSVNLQKFIGADGRVELHTADGKTIRRWPIDAKQMISQGGAKPVAVRTAAGAPARAATTSTSTEADDE